MAKGIGEGPTLDKSPKARKAGVFTKNKFKENPGLMAEADKLYNVVKAQQKNTIPQDAVSKLQREAIANSLKQNIKIGLQGLSVPKGDRSVRYLKLQGEEKRAQREKAEDIAREAEVKTKKEEPKAEEVIKTGNSELDDRFLVNPVETKNTTVYFPGAKKVVGEIGKLVDVVDKKEKEITNTEKPKEETSTDFPKIKVEEKPTEPVKPTEATIESSVSKPKKKGMEESLVDLQKANIINLFEKNMEMMKNVPVQPARSEVKRKMEELDGQGLNFSRDFKGTSFANRRAGVQLLREEIEKEKREEAKKEAIKPEESIVVPQGLKQELKADSKNLNGNKVEKELEQKGQWQTQPDTKTYSTSGVNSRVEFKQQNKNDTGKEKQQKKEIESVEKKGNQDRGIKNPEVVRGKILNINGRENGKKEKAPEKAKNTVENLVAQPTLVEAQVLNNFSESVKNNPESPKSRAERVAPRERGSEVLSATQDFENENEDLSSFDEDTIKRGQAILDSLMSKVDKKNTKQEGLNEEKKKGFWHKLWNGPRNKAKEILQKREARLNSPELKRKYEELNAQLEKDIGKIGNKSLNTIWDVTFGNSLKAIRDGITSNKNWSGATGEVIGSLVTRYLNSIYSIGEVVVGLTKVLGKKSWAGMKNLVGK